jgi:hypothetical protein
MMLKLGTIEQEAAFCRARWQGFGVGTLAAHVHHELDFEPLTQPAEKRIAFILNEKPEDERALRLRCFAPVHLAKFPKLRKSAAAWKKVYAAWHRAHAAWRKAEAKWERSNAKCDQAHAKWERSNAKCDQAHAKCAQAHAKCEQAAAALREICAAYPHAELCPLGSDCPWDGKTIFPEAK